MFSNVFYEWSREYNSSPPPALVPLSYPLPSKYIDQSTGIEHQLPPTYKARLNTAVPGLRVKVQYDLSAKIVRSRRKIPFITKTTRLVSHAHAHPPPHPFPLSYRSDPRNPPPFYLFPPHLFDRRFVSCPRIVDRLTFFILIFGIALGFTYRSSTDRDPNRLTASRCLQVPGSGLEVVNRDLGVRIQRRRVTVATKRRKSSSTPAHHYMGNARRR